MNTHLCQVGKLNVYRKAEAEELAGLHPSDRLMVKLIQIERLGPRIEGMLYKCKFEEQRLLLDEVNASSTIPRYAAECAGRVLGKLVRLAKPCSMLSNSKKC
jgi:hypothetical protein